MFKQAAFSGIILAFVVNKLNLVLRQEDILQYADPS